MRMQSELKADLFRMLTNDSLLPPKCWTHVYGISFGMPKFAGKVSHLVSIAHHHETNRVCHFMCRKELLNAHKLGYLQDLLPSIPECQDCMWNFIMEGDVMPGLMTCLPKDGQQDKWEGMLSSIDQGLQQSNVDDEELTEALQSGIHCDCS